jgi:hypothetical protein
MDEPEHEPPHAGKRLTREDVLRLIKEHGGPEGLDLRQANLEKADLRDLDLHGANLQDANLQWARLDEAKLQGTYLYRANLHRACLFRANLQKAQLWEANLHEAYLRAADLRRARLTYANLRDAVLEEINWGDHVLAEEPARDFALAASTYRALKQRHTEAGMYDVAGEFHYREMEARRNLARHERRFPNALGLNLSRWLYGYGERPQRVIYAAAAIVFGLALVHWLFGTVSGGFLEALYYSAVSFTALGYGASQSDPIGWAGRFLGAGESFLGVFMMALFLVTFTRKMTR